MLCFSISYKIFSIYFYANVKRIKMINTFVKQTSKQIEKMKLSEMSLSDLLALKQLLMQDFQAHLAIGNPFKADIISDVKLPKVLNAIRDIEESIIY